MFSMWYRRRNRSMTVIELLTVISCAFCLFLILIGIFDGCSCVKGLTVSSGFRDGSVQKFTEKGIIWSTLEGELAVRGIRGDIRSTWDFSVYSQSIAEEIQKLKPEEIVRLYYHQHRIVMPWTGETAYEVWKIEQVD